MIENTAELVRLLHVNRLHTEFWDGKWHWPSNADPQAVVTYASEPSPETGHVGWVWWALGRMGDAKTYEEARAAAEQWLRLKPLMRDIEEQRMGKTLVMK